jgi:hypothetical protein
VHVGIRFVVDGRPPVVLVLGWIERQAALAPVSHGGPSLTRRIQLSDSRANSASGHRCGMTVKSAHAAQLPRASRTCSPTKSLASSGDRRMLSAR